MVIPITDSQKLQRLFMSGDEPNKPYTHWRCGCGFDDNRNTDEHCKKCGERITCSTARGHSWTSGDTVCERGTCRVK